MIYNWFEFSTFNSLIIYIYVDTSFYLNYFAHDNVCWASSPIASRFKFEFGFQTFPFILFIESLCSFFIKYNFCLIFKLLSFVFTFCFIFSFHFEPKSQSPFKLAHEHNQNPFPKPKPLNPRLGWPTTSHQAQRGLLPCPKSIPNQTV